MAHRRGTATLARKLGERIRSLRLETGLTQEKLAWESDLAKNHLSQIESGKRVPSLPVIFALAKRLEVQPVDLLVIDGRTPHQSLLDAVRKKDRAGVAAALKLLGLG